MYFILLETTYHLQGADQAMIELMDFVRQTRDPNYAVKQQDILREIIDQKALEFWGEGIVMYDMKRLNMGVNCGYKGNNYYVEGRHNSEGRLPWWTYCIPQGELDRNEGITINNPDPSESLRPIEDIQ
jgi:hypothetical protein